MTPPRIIYTDLLPKGVDGMCPHPRLRLIRPKFRDDAVLLAHENVHAEQQRRDGWLRWVARYFLSPPQRRAYEAEAYRESARLNPNGLLRYANALSTMYGLDLTQAQAVELIA